MQTLMNQSNEFNQHTLSCIRQMPVPNQGLDQIDTQHTIRYSAIRTEKSQHKPHQPSPETHKQILFEKLFLKNEVS